MSAKFNIETTLKYREILHDKIKDLNEVELTAIPEKFNNNIIWNLGHMMVTQQLLIYKLHGLPIQLSNEFVANYRKGSVPSEGSDKPYVDYILEKFIQSAEEMLMDFDKNKFQNFTGYTTSTGVQISGTDEVFSFLMFHEGLHLMRVLDLARVL